MGNSLSLRLGAVAVCLCAAPAHADTIYQCAGQDGAPLLQNVPCQPGSEVWVQKDTGPAKSAPLAPSATQAATRAAPAADAASNDPGVMDRQEAINAKIDASATPGNTAVAESDELVNLPSEPDVGMTPRQVQAILGEPTAITQEEVVQGKVVTWSYGDSRVVQFDTTGRLSKK
jgi:hypothetical protein